MHYTVPGTQNSLGTVSLGYNDVLNINIKTDGYTVTPAHQILLESLERYPKSPICIDIYDWNHSRHELQSGCINQHIFFTIAIYLDLLYTVQSRWQEVRFDAPLINIINNMTKPRIPSGGPIHLESISIKQTHEAQDFESLRRFLSTLWSPRARKFSRFSIENYYTFDKQLFPNFPFVYLTHLEVDSTMTSEFIYEILKAATGMVKCRVSDVTTPGPLEYRSIVHAANLEYLGLEIDVMDHTHRRSGGIVELLHKLVAPSLRELRLAYEESWSDVAFIEFYLRSSFHLEVLHLEAMQMNSHQLSRILTISPSITELFVRGRMKDCVSGHKLFTDELWQQFMVNERRPHLCPDLESLCVCLLTAETENGWFRRMLRDRFHHTDLRQIKMQSADVISKQDLDALKVLHSYRMSVWLDDMCMGI